MNKRNFVIGVTKFMAGALVAGAVVAVPVTNVYAYTPSCSTTNQVGVKCDTIEVKTMDEAKDLVVELKKDGIKANLTLNCYSAEIESFLKANLGNMPVATLYECIKFVQKGGNNTTCQKDENKQNENNSTTCQKDENKQNGNNTTTCQKDENKQNGNNSTTCSKDEDKTATVESANNANSATITESTDKSPKTGDSTNILIMGGAMMISMLGIIAVYFRKRKHA